MNGTHQDTIRIHAGYIQIHQDVYVSDRKPPPSPPQKDRKPPSPQVVRREPSHELGGSLTTGSAALRGGFRVRVRVRVRVSCGGGGQPCLQPCSDEALGVAGLEHEPYLDTCRAT
jgi:hypothetical protein